MNVDKESLATAFAKWDADYRENPQNYISTVEHLLGNTPYSYGVACAAYLLKLLGDEG